MEENPFTSPMSSETVTGQGTSADVYEIAKRQRWLIASIGAYLLLIVGRFVVVAIVAEMPPQAAGPILILFGLTTLVVMVLVLVSLFSLSRKLHNTGLAILFVLLGMIPLVGLIVLVAVNGTATKYLKQHGIEVGFFGADLSQLQ